MRLIGGMDPISNHVSFSKCDIITRFRVGHCNENCKVLTMFPIRKWLQCFPMVHVYQMHVIQNKGSGIFGQKRITQDQSFEKNNG